MFDIISDRAHRIQPSATIAVATKAMMLKRQGRDVISLSAGEPDFDTPDFIKAAAIQAIQQGQTKYTPVEGTPQLREAIAQKFLRDQNILYHPSEILVSSGAKHSLFNLFQATLNKGDEVIIPVPAWVSYVDMVKLCDATPILVQTTAETCFKMTPQQLQHAITPRTKMLVINSPSNPTGMVYSEQELKALGAILKQYPKVLIASDDIYEHIYWGEAPFCAFITANPALKSRTVVINGASKVYAMTGWRIGYAAGSSEIIETMNKLQSQNASCACSISQAATLAALNAPQDFVMPMVQQFKARHDLIVRRLNALKGIRCLPASGAFYAFFDVRQACQNLELRDDLELATYLLDHTEVAFVPGSAFAAPGYLRASFATSEGELTRAMDRLEKVLGRT